MSGPCLTLRRQLLLTLQRERAAAVYAGDRFLGETLDALIRSVKQCVAYAENQRHYAAAGRLFAGQKMNRLPPSENARDNRAGTGGLSA